MSRALSEDGSLESSQLSSLSTELPLCNWTGVTAIRSPMYLACCAWGWASDLWVRTRWKKWGPDILVALTRSLASAARSFGKWEIVVAYLTHWNTLSLEWELRKEEGLFFFFLNHTSSDWSRWRCGGRREGGREQGPKFHRRLLSSLRFSSWINVASVTLLP